MCSSLRSYSLILSPPAGFWEQVTPLLKDYTFDGIVFDPFPSSITFEFMVEARRLLKPGGVLTYYLQQWGSSGQKAWGTSRRQLLSAGFQEHEIHPPEYIHLDIRSDCGHTNLRECPMERITMIIPRVVRAANSGVHGDDAHHASDDLEL